MSGGASHARLRAQRKKKVLEMATLLPRTKRELVEGIGAPVHILESLMGELISEGRLVKESPPGSHVELWSAVEPKGR